MKKMDVIKHAANIAKFMEAISNALMSEIDNPTVDPMVRPRSVGIFDILGDFENNQTSGLGDIGLDDMSLRRIVIELSTDRTHFKIWTPFKDGFISELKRQIPKHSREWDENDRCWRVDTYWFGNAQRLLHDHFPDLERVYTNRAIRMCEQLAHEDEQETEQVHEVHEEPEQPRRHRKRKSTKKAAKARSCGFVDDAEEDEEPKRKRKKADSSPYTVLGVSPEAPDEVIKAAHKALARKYHTDLGGDEKKMKQVNEAFEKIKEIRAWTTI